MPSFAMPPPLIARPLAMVSPEISAVTPLEIKNTRDGLGSCGVGDHMIVILSAPGPSIVTWSRMINADQVDDPLTLTKTITSTPARALASRIAWRSEPLPESLRFWTVNLAASARPGVPKVSDAATATAMTSGTASWKQLPWNALQISFFRIWSRRESKNVHRRRARGLAAQAMLHAKDSPRHGGHGERMNDAAPLRVRRASVVSRVAPIAFDRGAARHKRDTLWIVCLLRLRRPDSRFIRPPHGSRGCRSRNTSVASSTGTSVGIPSTMSSRETATGMDSPGNVRISVVQNRTNWHW